MSNKISLSQMTLNEVLSEINSDVSLLKTRYSFRRGSAMHKVFAYAFLPQLKWVFPETTPPYTPSDLTAGMTPTDILIAINHDRFDYFGPKSKINQIAREKLFIQLLESVDANDAKVLLAIKDQNLTKMYPNITYEVLADAGYLPVREEKQKEDAKEFPSPKSVKEEPKSVTKPQSKRTTKTPVRKSAATTSKSKRTTVKSTGSKA